MNRKFLNYAIFILIVGVVVGLAVNHSRHMAYLVSSMAGPDSAARVAAAKELVKNEQFMDSINGETVKTRVKVVQALEDWGDKDATKQLVAFLKDPDRPVRDRILLALLRVGTKSKDNLQELVNGIKDGDANVRKYCVKALQILGSDTPQAAEAQVPKDQPREEIMAAWQKRDVGVAANIVPMVVEIILKEAGGRAAGGDVLGGLPEHREQSVRLLRPLITDKDEGVRAAAAEAMGKVGSKSAIPDLIRAMHKDTPQVRRIAIGAIALIAAPSGEAALIEAINNPDDDNEARAQAVAGLGKIATPTAIAVLIKALDDYDLKVQEQTVDALARAGDKAIGALTAALHAPKQGVRARAAQALGKIQSPKSVNALIAALKDPDATVRAAAAAALGFSNNRQAVEPLIVALRDPDGGVAKEAADALARIGEPARPALARAMAGNHSVAAYLAANALGKQGPSAARTVEQAATTPSAQRWAVVALGSMGGPEAVAVLEKLVNSSDPITRDSAQLALKRLGAQ